MEKHEAVRPGPEERLQRAARIFAMGAIRAAMKKQAASGGTGASDQNETELAAGRGQAPAEPAECEWRDR